MVNRGLLPSFLFLLAAFPRSAAASYSPKECGRLQEMIRGAEGDADLAGLAAGLRGDFKANCQSQKGAPVLELVEVWSEVYGKKKTEPYAYGGSMKWDYDAREGRAHCAAPWGDTKFAVAMPAGIEAGGSDASMRIVITRAREGFAPAMGVRGDADTEPAANLGVRAAKGEDKDETRSFRITPRKYPESVKTVDLRASFQDSGLEFVYRYRVVRN